MNWWCYIVRCKDGSFYTGITNDLKKRIDKHNAGKAAKYTRNKRPVVLVYKEQCESKSSALKRECSIKKLSRIKKEKLIAESVLIVEVYERWKFNFPERVKKMKSLMKNNIEDKSTPKTKDGDSK